MKLLIALGIAVVLSVGITSFLIWLFVKLWSDNKPS